MEQTNHKRTFKGIVVSDTMNKTRVVRVDTVVAHPKYKKRYVRSKRFKVHDEGNSYHVGDAVLFQETRPLSREKRWRIIGAAAA